MRFCHIYCDFLSKFDRVQFCFVQELIGDINEGISWPRMEPIDRSGVDNTWEFSSSDSHSLAYRGEAQDDLQLLLHPIVEVVQETVD